MDLATSPDQPEQFSSSTATQMHPDLVVSGKIRRQGVWTPGEIWISDGKVAAVFDSANAPATAAKRIEVGNSYVLPGAVDAHVHSLSHVGEGVRASTRAAAAGGVTTIVEMPFDGRGPINSVDRIRAKQDLIQDEALIDVALLGTLAPNGGWRKAEALVSEGAVGFKVSLFDTDPARFPRIDDRELLNVMKAVGGTGRTLCAHVENNEIVKALLLEEAGAHPDDVHAHTRSRPPVSETLGVLTAMEIAAMTGNALHLCHLSLPRSIDLVSWYQGQGADISLETCPHYLTFTRHDLDAHRGRLKINPPLREGKDREGLWHRIDAGAVTVISSDHAPWPVEMKDHQRILDNHSGVPGVETLVATTLGQALLRGERAFNQAVDALTIGPARRFGLDRSKGSLEVGKDADIAVFTPDPSYAIDGSALHSNAGWSPYNGSKPGGHVSLTLSRGETVWRAGSGLTGTEGRGHLVGSY
ncbi:dihydroorotase family protein [Arthrobacter sp. NPDC058127]|uniref:dihydroorotase n=1 Tax=Arthrobacter sp. NPDC058127 TaxID=3346351 RepID=UPI0036E0151A